MGGAGSQDVANEAHARVAPAASLLLVLVLAALAAVLGVVVLLDDMDRRLVALLVDAGHHELAEELGVHVRVGERACAREELLDVGLVRQVRHRHLEDDVVEREAEAQVPHHLELVEHPVGRVELLQLLGRQVLRLA